MDVLSTNWKQDLRIVSLVPKFLLFALPAMIALLAVQSSAQTFIHNAILFIDTFNNAWYNQVLG